MLTPLEQATLRLEGRPGTPTGGDIWEILPVFEWLLHHFEELKVRYANHPNPHFRHNVNLAWMKLDKYYALTDNSPVYVAGVVFHPRMKWGFIEKHWSDKPDWRDRAKEAVRNLWETEYKTLPLPTPPAPPPAEHKVAYTSGLNDFLNDLIGPPAPASDVDDEYEEYCNRKDPEDLNCNDPFKYWLTKRVIWPRLSRMALDIISIPCMSDEPERIFSLAGLLTPSMRARLGSDFIGASLCLADWDKRGVVNILG
ncbi:Ribonuclease H-like protein, partial [Metarhizium majus ARSEF 297]